MIDAVFSFFALSWVPWTLSGLLILGALGTWLDFRRRLQPVLQGLDEALRVVQEATSASTFVDRFPSINQRLASNRVIGASWRAFAQTLVPVPGHDDALGATRRPREDLNENILTSAGVNLRFYMAVPNYLVGLGLLFTFLGLVAALYFASAGVAAADIQDAQRALRDLLGAATFKFVTSIAGLAASIVYSSREKTHLYRFGHRLTELCIALEQRLVPVTPEYLGTVQLAEMKSQSTLLRRLGRHLPATLPAVPEAAPDPADSTPIDETVARLIELFDSSSAGIAALDRDLEASLDQIKASFQQFRAAPSADGLPATEQTSHQLAASLARLAETRTELGELGRAFRSVASSSRSMLEAYHARSEGCGGGDPQLATELDQLGQQVLRFNERVRGFVRRVDEELVRSSKLLGRAVDGAKER